MDNYKYGIKIILVIFTLIFLPLIIDRIPNERIKFIFSIVFFSILFIFILYEFYKDVINNHYSTTKFILLSDLIIIFLYIVFVILVIKNFNKILSLNFKLNLDNIILIPLPIIIIRHYLKSKRFKNKNN